jgi:predicted transglutaminase-like cysteine proteinase
MDLTISSTLYQQYKSVPQYLRTMRGVNGYSLLVTTQDTYIKQLTDKLHEAATKEGYGPLDEVSFVLSFVQSLKYTSDSATTGYDEYPRFPVETLVDEGGDCEDTTILFATLVENLGYGVIFINPPNHVAVGVKGDNLDGNYYTYGNATYYY